MKKIVKDLKTIGYDLSQMQSADFFARTGDFFTKDFSDEVKSIDCYEIESKYSTELHKNIPNAKIFIKDSIKFINNSKANYDLISLDSPQGIYGPYCEHFDFIHNIGNMFDKKCIVMFVVNLTPYDPKDVDNSNKRDDYGMSDNQEWYEIRMDYYETDSKDISKEYAISFYTDLFQENGLDAKFLTSSFVPSHIDNVEPYVIRFAFELKKNYK